MPLRLLHLSFSNTPLTHLSVNTRSPPYPVKRFRLFALTTTSAMLMRWCLLMTPPAILVTNAMSNYFWSIPKSNLLGLPILLVPSLHFFFQMLLPVVLIKEYFGYLVVNFLITEAVPKSLAYRPTFLNLRKNFDLIFFLALICLLHLLFSVSKLCRSNIFCHWS